MATSVHDDALHDPGPDRQAEFITAVAKKYEAEDAKESRREDGDDDEEIVKDEVKKDDQTDDTTDDDEHTDADTSADASDGKADDSGKDSTDDDEDEHADGKKPEDSADDETADDDEDLDEEEDDEVSDETKGALKARGADLTLEDVPEEYRPLVAKKLKSVDAAFTRVMQEATAFRADRAKFDGEERFRKENPDIFVIEMLEADPALLEKVNERFKKLDDPDQAEALKVIAKDKRAEAHSKVKAEIEEGSRWITRGKEVEDRARERAATLKLDWRIAERAIESALLKKPEGKRDLTDEEIDTVIADEAREFVKVDREKRRALSKEIVKGRTESRNAAPPAAKRPSGTSSPRPAPAKTPKIDWSSEESRQAALMTTAKRVHPGAR